MNYLINFIFTITVFFQSVNGGKKGNETFPSENKNIPCLPQSNSPKTNLTKPNLPQPNLPQPNLPKPNQPQPSDPPVCPRNCTNDIAAPPYLIVDLIFGLAFYISAYTQGVISGLFGIVQGTVALFISLAVKLSNDRPSYILTLQSLNKKNDMYVTSYQLNPCGKLGYTYTPIILSAAVKYNGNNVFVPLNVPLIAYETCVKLIIELNVQLVILRVGQLTIVVATYLSLVLTTNDAALTALKTQISSKAVTYVGTVPQIDLLNGLKIKTIYNLLRDFLLSLDAYLRLILKIDLMSLLNIFIRLLPK